MHILVVESELNTDELMEGVTSPKADFDNLIIVPTEEDLEGAYNSILQDLRLDLDTVLGEEDGVSLSFLVDGEESYGAYMLAKRLGCFKQVHAVEFDRGEFSEITFH